MATTEKKMFEWTPDYAVQDKMIDGEHKELFARAERLHAAMRAGKGKDILAGLIEELLAYTRGHFAHEEELMRKTGYTGLAGQVQEHQGLTRRVAEFQQRFVRGESMLTIDLMTFLSQWLDRHIKSEDRKIGVFVREKK